MCCNCRKEYTLDRGRWPDWLRYWMKNYQDELNYERKVGINLINIDDFDDDGDIEDCE